MRHVLPLRFRAVVFRPACQHQLSSSEPLELISVYLHWSLLVQFCQALPARKEEKLFGRSFPSLAAFRVLGGALQARQAVCTVAAQLSCAVASFFLSLVSHGC
jgi:hypothetical protein